MRWLLHRKRLNPLPMDEEHRPLDYSGARGVPIYGYSIMARCAWGDVTRRALERRFNHPRLVGLTQMWAGILVAGWLCAMILLFLYPLVPVTYAVFLAGLGPWLAMVLFDRRR